MAKIFTYMIISVTIWSFLTILGITITGSYFASHLGLTDAASIANIQSSSVWLAIIAGFIALGTGTVIIGVFTKTISAIPATAALATAIFIFIITDLILVINVVPEIWMRNVLWLIIAPWTAGFIVAAWDWVRGID